MVGGLVINLVRAPFRRFGGMGSMVRKGISHFHGLTYSWIRGVNGTHPAYRRAVVILGEGVR